MTGEEFEGWNQLVRPGVLATKCQQVLDVMAQQWPVDALSIMMLKEDCLVPVCASGLTKDALGRRFELAHQPRFQAILATHEAVHFAHDADLRDPFDGLIPNHKGKLNVHDCMGVRIDIQGKAWGLLTLDALKAGSFTTELQAHVKNWVTLLSAVIEQDEALKRASSGRFFLPEDANISSELTMIGNSASMSGLQQAISVVAGSELTVLIQGETGTGKELVAKAIHAQSTRAKEHYIFVNCAALPEQLAESELFGHVKGAFTGAVSERKGKFELAHKGTLFLDEVGELPLAVQAKLLRAIQSGEIQRVGSDAFHHVDVRIVAATNRNLANMVTMLEFRADLYHRLSVYPIHVPPLREREQDILLLSGFFIEKSRAQMGLRGLRVAPSAEAVLLQYNWPGNVRELEHSIARAALKAVAQNPGKNIVTLTPEYLDLLSIKAVGEPHNDPKPYAGFTTLSMPQAVKSLQIDMIEKALQDSAGNWAQAAKILQLDGGNLHRLAKRLGLK
jgi:anaerobic nitric oxide reductase transcription regulator